jgi:hypothetical protein
MIDLKTLKSEVFNKVILLPSYVEYGKLKLPAGKAVFDTQRMMVLQQVSDKYELTTIPDLISEIKQTESIRFISFYKTKSLDTIYLTGYFPKHKVEDNYIGFEMGVSYISRFSPFINLGIYFTKGDRFARISYPYNICSNDPNSNIESIKNLYFLSVVRYISQDFLLSIWSIVPRSIKEDIKKLIEPHVGKQVLYREYLEIIASVTKRWSFSSYERAREFQLNLSRYSVFSDILKEKE